MRAALVVLAVLLVGAVGVGVGYGVGGSGGATGGTADDHAELACQGAEGLPDELAAQGEPGQLDLARASAITGVAGFAEAAAEGDDAYAAMADPAERLRVTVAALSTEQYPDAISDLRAACDDR